MSNYKVTGTDLTNIADIIRAKGGTSEPLVFPPDFISAIENLGESYYLDDAYINGSITNYEDSQVTYIRNYAFVDRLNLISVSFPACIEVGEFAFFGCENLSAVYFSSCSYIADEAFGDCYSLSVASFPSCSVIGGYAFYNCSTFSNISFSNCVTMGDGAFGFCVSLTTANFPACTNMGNNAFEYCSSLTAVSFPVCTNIGSNAFRYCDNLISLYLTSVSAVPTLGNSVFDSTPIGGYTTSGIYGSVFVPLSLYNSFLVATNWASISDRIVGI